MGKLMFSISDDREHFIIEDGCKQYSQEHLFYRNKSLLEVILMFPPGALKIPCPVCKTTYTLTKEMYEAEVNKFFGVNNFKVEIP